MPWKTSGNQSVSTSKDMAFALDNYLKIFDGDLPQELQGHKDIIFANYPGVHKFHNE